MESKIKTLLHVDNDVPPRRLMRKLGLCEQIHGTNNINGIDKYISSCQIHDYGNKNISNSVVEI